MRELLFSFKGRISRKTYWLYCCIPLLLIGAILELTAANKLIYSLVFLAIIWPSLAMHIKRWHDQDKSGWWQLLGIIPYLGGFIVIIMCGFIRGTEGANKFGATLLESELDNEEEGETNTFGSDQIKMSKGKEPVLVCENCDYTITASNFKGNSLFCPECGGHLAEES